MGPSDGQNLSNFFTYLGLGLGLLAACAAYYFNHFAKNAHPHWQQKRLKTANGFAILAMVIALVAKLSSSYFDGLQESVKPYRQPIRTATANVEITFRSSESYKVGKTIGQGGYLIFANAAQALLATSGTDYYVDQQEGDRVTFRGVFPINPGTPGVAQLVSDLRSAGYVQIAFAAMPSQAHVIEGRAIVLVNNEVQLEILIPEQDINGQEIFATDLKQAFRDFK